MNASQRLNYAVSANARAAFEFSERLTDLSESAHDMGQDRLARTLAELATQIKAQADHVSRMYGEALHDEFDQGIATTFATISDVLARPSPPKGF